MEDYYTCKPGGEPAGPFSAEEIRRQITAGELAENDFICPTGSETWAQVGHLFPGQPPLPTTPPPHIQPDGPDWNDPAIAAAANNIQEFCTSQETILTLVIQSKLSAHTLFPDIIAATTRRLIILSRSITGTTMFDILWPDLADVQIQECMLSSVLIIRDIHGRQARIQDLPKADARRFYRFAQEREEQVRVLRHQLQIQHARAGASQIIIGH